MADQQQIEQQLREQYRSVKSHLKAWGEKVDQYVMALLSPLAEKHRIQIKPEFRVKNEDSYIGKALYRNKSYTDPLLQIEDKIGTRVVVLLSEDVYAAADLLKQFDDWEYKVGRDHRDEIENDPKLFDYQSVHLTVWPKKSTSEFPENVVNLLTCEVQIRTLLQHAYAEVGHDNVYKGAYKNDKGINRKLAKSMALMESTDDYFCEIFKLMTNEQQPYQLFLGELTKRYRLLNPQFDLRQVDVTLSDLVFELLAKQQVGPADIDRMLTERSDDVKPYINANKTFLFNQPIILLIAYYLFNHQRFLEREWPLNQQALQGVKTGFGYGSR